MKVKSFKVELDPSVGVEYNVNIIAPIDLQDLNLIVGKNASGKTTITNVIYHISRILSGNTHPYWGNFSAQLVDENLDNYSYYYSSSIGGKTKETLFKNDIALINRDNGSAKIYSENYKDYEIVNPPNISILSARRDSKAYPYIEKLIKWAEGVYFFEFGKLLSASADRNSSGIYTSAEDFNTYLGEINDETKHKVVSEFNTIGYEVTLLDFFKMRNQYFLSIKEKGIELEVDEISMSQGMFRSLWLLLYINFLIEKGNASLIIIDDLCEGLDYDRATALGKLLFAKMKEQGVQFIATTNDRFLMNVVDIENWNIISREGNTIKSINYTNSKEQFDNFHYTGLSNFDLFTSDFLLRKK